MSYCDHWMSVLHCVSCIVNNWFKGHLLLNYWLDFDQTWQELSLYMAPFNNCSNGFGPLHIYGKSCIGSYGKQIVFLAVYELMKIIFLKKNKTQKNGTVRTKKGEILKIEKTGSKTCKNCQRGGNFCVSF